MSMWIVVIRQCERTAVAPPVRVHARRPLGRTTQLAHELPDARLVG